MKFSQNDLILCIAAVVVMLGANIAFIFLKPVPKTVPAPQEVPLGAPALPSGNVAYSTSLSGGGNSRGMGGGFGMRGGPPSGMMGGPPGGMPGRGMAPGRPPGMSGGPGGPSMGH